VAFLLRGIIRAAIGAGLSKLTEKMTAKKLQQEFVNNYRKRFEKDAKRISKHIDSLIDLLGSYDLFPELNFMKKLLILPVDEEWKRLTFACNIDLNLMKTDEKFAKFVIGLIKGELAFLSVEGRSFIPLFFFKWGVERAYNIPYKWFYKEFFRKIIPSADYNAYKKLSQAQWEDFIRALDLEVENSDDIRHHIVDALNYYKKREIPKQYSFEEMVAYGQIEDVKKLIPENMRAVAVFYGTNIVKELLPEEYSELNERHIEFLEAYDRCVEGALSFVPRWFLSELFWEKEYEIANIFCTPFLIELGLLREPVKKGDNQEG